MATLFELSWEVCNKVGGIHTVLRSKAAFMRGAAERHIVLGPHLPGKNSEFVQTDPPEEFARIFEGLAGVTCHYGSWAIPGRPEAILLDFGRLLEGRDALKAGLWERYGIDSIRAGFDFDEPLCFSLAAALLVDAYAREHKEVVLHCHEWMAGLALLHLKDLGSPARSVFTTHATMLGRSISGAGHPLYDMLGKLDPAEWAYRLNVQEKHLTEVACARHATVFTTVSDVTAQEARALLGTSPHVITYNGFHTERFPTFEETSLQHAQSKEALLELIAYHFFPHYAFDLERTRLFFTSGRYEFHNKGLDILIDALGEVNRDLAKDAPDIVMFFWVIMGRRNIRLDVLEKKNHYLHIKNQVEWQARPLIKRVIRDFLSGHKPASEGAFTRDFIAGLDAHLPPQPREGPPSIPTHEIEDEGTDPLLAACRKAGLLNRAEDKVKVILHPGYLDGSDGLLNVGYYDATVGCHLGVFPSAYEPWGYTPLESAALGVPTITTNASGFGRFMQHRLSQKGIGVLSALGKPREEVVADLARMLLDFATLPHNERVQHGYGAKLLASCCDWQEFIGRYKQAYEAALR